MAELELKNVRCSYGSKVVLDNVNFKLGNGVVALLGLNGAGKTTLIKNIMKLMYPEQGDIFFDGQDIFKIGSRYYDYLGYMPQMPNFYNNFKAYEFLLYIASLKGITKKEAKVKAADLLEKVQLSYAKDKKIDTFSGGMKQRLGIAQALLNNPKLLILDEPTAGLDPNERIKFRNIITELAAERIVILATHIISDIESIAKDILLVKDGKVELCTDPKGFVSDINGKVYMLEVPDSDSLKKVVAECKVSNIRECERGFELRIISDSPKYDNVVKVEPNLEDAFLVYFDKQDKIKIQ